MSNYVAVAQWIKCFAGELNDPGLIPSQGEFFHLNFFQRGNEPNGEEQQEQIKVFLG